MQVKRVLIAILSCLLIVSCASRPNEISATTYPHMASTLVVTATPIAESGEQDMGQILHNIYGEKFSSCKSSSNLNSEQDVLEFFDTNLDFNKLLVEEIADSEGNKYRAYLAVDLTLAPSNCETGCSLDRIYIENVARGDVQGINWHDYMPARITQNLMWIGDSVLAFWQNINPYNGEIIAINVKEKTIIYRSLISCN